MKALGPKTVNIATLELAPPSAHNAKKCLKALRTLYYKPISGCGEERSCSALILQASK